MSASFLSKQQESYIQNTDFEKIVIKAGLQDRFCLIFGQSVLEDYGTLEEALERQSELRLHVVITVPLSKKRLQGGGSKK